MKRTTLAKRGPLAARTRVRLKLGRSSPGAHHVPGSPPVPRDPVFWSTRVQSEREIRSPKPWNKPSSLAFLVSVLSSGSAGALEGLLTLSQRPGKQEWKEGGFYFLLPSSPAARRGS